MKNLKFAEALNSEVENIVENTKVSAAGKFDKRQHNFDFCYVCK